MTDEEISQAASDVAKLAPWQWKHEIFVAALVKLKAARLETARAAAELCETPSMLHSTSRECGEAIRASFGVKP